MTDSQWLQIRERVSKELAKEAVFTIDVYKFMREFGLTFPFYEALQAHIAHDQPGFDCQADCKFLPTMTFQEMNDQPAGNIVFRRSPATESQGQNR